MKQQEIKVWEITVSLVAEAEKRGIRITSDGIKTLDPDKVIREDRDAFFDYLRRVYEVQPKKI